MDTIINILRKIDEIKDNLIERKKAATRWLKRRKNDAKRFFKPSRKKAICLVSILVLTTGIVTWAMPVNKTASVNAVEKTTEKVSEYKTDIQSVVETKKETTENKTNKNSSGVASKKIVVVKTVYKTNNEQQKTTRKKDVVETKATTTKKPTNTTKKQVTTTRAQTTRKPEETTKATTHPSTTKVEETTKATTKNAEKTITIYLIDSDSNNLDGKIKVTGKNFVDEIVVKNGKTTVSVPDDESEYKIQILSVKNYTADECSRIVGFTTGNICVLTLPTK